MQSIPSAPLDTAPANRFWIGAGVILILSIVLRQLGLGEASFHPDEAIHTHFSMGFGDYKYDPVYHGPLLYHLVAASFGLFQQNDISARIVPSLLGIGLVALIIGPLRHWLGHRGALAAAALVAISPSIVTYSRRLLHDSLALFLTMGAVLCFLSALQNGADTERGRGARIGLFAFLSLFLATKANCFFVAVMLLAFWIAWRLAGYIRLPVALSRWIPVLLFALVIALSVAFPRDNSFSEALKISQHRVFQIGALACCVAFGLWLLTAPKTTQRQEEQESAAVTTSNVTIPVDVWTTYILALAGALWLYVFLFGNGAQILAHWVQERQFPTQILFDGARNAREAIPKMLRYWGGQQGKPRLPGRHDYYLVLALLYEIPILLAALGGIWHAAKHRSTFTDLLLWWSFSSLAVYAVANEKVPWLLVHILLPLALLGGVWLGQLHWKKPVLAIAALAGFLFCLRGASGVNFERGGDHIEPLLYAQTPEVFRDALQKTLLETRGDTRPIWMAGEEILGNRQWPTVWYLRESGPNVDGSPSAIAGVPTPDSYRAAISNESQWIEFANAGWKGTTVDFLIWPRASWAAIAPQRYLPWFWTRDALPKSERDLPQSEWKISILSGQGEWSHATAVVGRPQ